MLGVVGKPTLTLMALRLFLFRSYNESDHGNREAVGEGEGDERRRRCRHRLCRGAEGDLSQALQWAVTDLLRTRIAVAEARNAISYGYVRKSPSSAGDSRRRLWYKQRV